MTWRLVKHLDGSPLLLPLARALCATLGLGDEVIPEACEYAPRRPWSRAVGDARVSLGVESYGVDPYAGGASSEEWLRVEGMPDRSLRASISEIAWVGPELEVNASGPPEWLAAVAALVEVYVAQHAR